VVLAIKCQLDVRIVICHPLTPGQAQSTAI
jgi:hypothetical protein